MTTQQARPMAVSAPRASRRQEQGVPEDPESNGGGPGVPGLPAGDGGMAVAAGVGGVHLSHAFQQLRLGQAAGAIVPGESFAVGPHDESHLGGTEPVCISFGFHIRTPIRRNEWSVCTIRIM